MRSVYTILFLIIIPVFIFSGDDLPFIKQLQEKLSFYLKIRGEETVYVQTDKPFYSNGEDIWFTAFVVDATNNNQTTKSDIVYVELSDPKGNTISKVKIPIVDGLAKGDFRLGKDGAGGIYRLRAYTQWMRNFGEENYFNKEIYVQKVLTPNLLLRPDFEKKAYGASDEVILKLSVTDLENQPAVNAEITSSVSVNGEITETIHNVSDKDGVALIKFNLPENMNKADGTVNMMVNYRGVSESVFRTIPIVLKRIKLSFYPEGGDLVFGFASRVAFEALDEFGKGADVSGIIEDDAGNSVTTFESFHFGMGAFDFTPESGKKYYARITLPKGNNTRFSLPEVEGKYGLNLLEQTQSEIKWRIYSPIKEKAAMTVQVHGVMYYNKTTDLSEGVNFLSVPIHNLPAGIAVATLFDGNGTEQCERLVFVNEDKVLNISLETDRKYYNPGEEVKLKVKTADNKGNPTSANLALSVVDDRLLAFADDRQDNIMSYLLLSSELKGKISEPSFYFNPDEKKAKKAVDYLLLTHGWRRFTWKILKSNISIPNILPEKSSTIAGFVTDRKGTPKKSEVTLIEKSGKKRIMKIESGAQGQFVFYNVDQSSSVVIMTKYPNQINIWNAPNESLKTFTGDSAGVTAVIPLQNTLPDTPGPDNTTQSRKTYYEDGSISRSSYISGSGGLLQEVVITGYGVSRKVGFHNADRLDYFNSNLEIEYLPAGQIPYIYVSPRNSNAGVPFLSPMSGSSLYSVGSNMLVSVNENSLNTVTNPNFTFSGAFNINEITSVYALNSNEAVLKYGMHGVHGALEISTRKIDEFPKRYKPVFRRPKYRGIELFQLSDFYKAREFYAPPPRKEGEKRKDYRTTVFWSGRVKTDNNGLQELSFRNNDATTAFRIIAEGLGKDGLIGRAENNYSTVMPVSLDVKTPFYMNYEDIAYIPVTVKNTTEEEHEGIICLEVDNGLDVKGKRDTAVTVKPQQTITIYFTLTSKMKNGRFPVKIKYSGESDDMIEREISVSDMGFPKSVSLSGNSDRKIDFTYDDVIPGTLEVSAVLNTNIIEDLSMGVKSIAGQPHGCFEQVSSCNYPNIIALQFLQVTNNSDKELKNILLNYLDSGYRQLKAYEIDGGGFEWFGGPPAHTVLTAYGLMQFFEMLPVYTDIDKDLEKLIVRTRDFLMKQRKGDGTFKQTKGKYGFQAGPEKINNAYVTFVLAETGSKDILPEYKHALQEVLTSKDMYRMALLANAAFNLGISDDYDSLVDLFLKELHSGSIDKIKVEGSFISGNTGRQEAVAHWVNALMKNNDKYMNEIQMCIDYIVTFRSSSGFGSTQATAMCLKALAQYALVAKNKMKDSKMMAKLNNGEAEFMIDSISKKSIIKQSFFEKHIKTGNNTLSSEIVAGKSSYPYSIDIKWKVKTPDKSFCPLVLTTKLSKQEVKVNEFVRMEIVMKNTFLSGHPMSMIEIGIPGGLSLQPNQLKELKDKGVYDFYEIFDNRLVIYYRELGPYEEKFINLDLKAEIPGDYEGAASSTYLYYLPDSRHWLKGEKINIFK